MGKKHFANGSVPAVFTLIDSILASGGVIIANSQRAGKVKIGTIGA